MTELEFRQVLREAMCDEYSWAPAPQDLHYTYTFSPAFEVRMKKKMEDYTVFPKPLHNADRHRFVGRFTLRRVAVVILAAVLVLALAACAVYYLRVHWNETQNDAQGTLDITFDVEGVEDSTNEAFVARRPQTPEGFTVAAEKMYATSFEIEYRDDANVIYYDQTGGIEAMGLSIDNEDESFQKVMIGECKGYAVTKSDSPYVTWSDGIYLYYLSGNVAYETLKAMAESIS